MPVITQARVKINPSSISNHNNQLDSCCHYVALYKRCQFIYLIFNLHVKDGKAIKVIF